MKLILHDIHHRTSGSILLIQDFKASLCVILDSIADPSTLMWPLFIETVLIGRGSSLSSL